MIGQEPEETEATRFLSTCNIFLKAIQASTIHFQQPLNSVKRILKGKQQREQVYTMCHNNIKIETLNMLGKSEQHLSSIRF